MSSIASKPKSTKTKAAATAAPPEPPAPVEPAPARSAAPKSRAKAKPAAPAVNLRQTAELFKQVSEPTRLLVLMLLDERERNVSEIAGDLPQQSQPSVSHHLALLRHGRLIEPRRVGKNNVYTLTETGRELAGVVKSVIEDR